MISVKIPVQSPTAVRITTQAVENGVVGDIYTGDYVVEPDLEPIVLKTKFKSMTDDVTVKKIPVWETSNEAGGTTCLIGGEKYYGI